ncbi:MAG: fatty acid desaturase [Gemmataceae bacterium]|nr:fatty acid desaturase [Gemmataceae bacterium]
MSELPTTAHAPRVQVDPDLLDDLHRIDGHHYRRLIAFVVLFVAAAAGLYVLVVQWPDSAWRWLASVPLYLLAAASLHGISLFTHEGVHGTLSLSRPWNRALSIACALPVLQNYSAYRVLHLRHHLFLGREGDPDHFANYTSWTWLEFLMHWGRLIIGYPAYLIAIPILGYRQGNATDRRWMLFEVALLAALTAAVLLSPLPGELLIHAWLVPMLVINTMVNIRGMSQHTFLEHHSDPILGTRSLLTNPVTRFFMCNENYHLEHHLFPGVPWYNLSRLHSALSRELTVCGAPYLPSYFAFVREFVAGSLRRSPLGR